MIDLVVNTYNNPRTQRGKVKTNLGLHSEFQARERGTSKTLCKLSLCPRSKNNIVEKQVTMGPMKIQNLREGNVLLASKSC